MSTIFALLFLSFFVWLPFDFLGIGDYFFEQGQRLRSFLLRKFKKK